MVDNRGNDTILFSFGLHPYFNLSSVESLRFEGLPARRLDHLTIEDDSTTGQRPDRLRSWPAASTCWCGPELAPPPAATDDQLPPNGDFDQAVG